MKTVAVIDIGSNTVLYLLASNESGLTVLDEGIAPTRLGKGMGISGDPDESSIKGTIAAVEKFAEKARKDNADEIIIVATEAMRRAPWGESFTANIEDIVGVPVKVLSPQEEGELSLIAARRSLTVAEKAITVVDVGGGSAQIIYDAADELTRVDSYPLGCVLLTDRFASGGELDRDSLLEYTDNELGDKGRIYGPVVITGGTATTAAAIIEGMDEYSPDVIHGKAYTANQFRELAGKITGLSLERRKNLAGMPPARADIFEAGLLVLLAILDKSENADAVLSCKGVRFGAAYRYFDSV